MKSILIVFLLVFGCGSDSPFIDNDIVTVNVDPPLNRSTGDPRKYKGINKEFKPYVELFEDLYGRRVKNLPINFDKLEDNAVGACYTYVSVYSNTIYKEVFISAEFWDRASNNERENVVLHELGHCILNRNHDSTFMEYGKINIPKSMMYPSVIGSYNFYEKKKDYYRDELVGE